MSLFKNFKENQDKNYTNILKVGVLMTLITVRPKDEWCFFTLKKHDKLKQLKIRIFCEFIINNHHSWFVLHIFLVFNYYANCPKNPLISILIMKTLIHQSITPFNPLNFNFTFISICTYLVFFFSRATTKCKERNWLILKKREMVLLP